MRVAIVSEFYPRAHDPVLGVWAHRQALAARDAGADVRVLVLHRPVPPRADARCATRPAPCARWPRSRGTSELDGIDVRYVPFVAPPRSRTLRVLGRVGGADARGARCARLRGEFPYDLVHAHNAVPAADAVLRARVRAPLVVSVHGGDVYFTAPRHPAGARAVRRAFGAARLVLANSAGIEAEAPRLGAHAHARRAPGHRRPRAARRTRRRRPTLVTVGHLVARKRHADVLRALWLLRERHPQLRYLIIGDGPEREPLERLAARAGRRRPRRVHRPAPARGGAGARRARAHVVRHAERRRGLRRRLHRGDGRRAAGGRRARRGRARRRSRAAGDGMRLVAARRRRGAGGASSTRCSPSPRYLQRARRRARATRSRARSRGSSAGARRSPAYEDALR